MFLELWESLFDFFEVLCSFGGVMTAYFTTRLDVLAYQVGLDGALMQLVLAFPIGETTIGRISIMNMLFGVGIPLWVVWSIVKWFTDAVA